MNLSYLPSLEGIKTRFEKRSLIIFLLLGSLVVVLIGFMAFRSKGSDVSEQQEIEWVSKLIGMQKDLNDLRRQLDEKRSNPSQLRGEGRSSRRQGGQADFVGFTPGAGFHEIQNAKRDLYIPRGSVFKAKTLTSIKTSIAESIVIAETTRTFEMDAKRRIPSGTRLIGTAKLNPVLKGLIVRFDSMVLPSQVQIDNLRLLALDQSAFPELTGIYFSNQAEVYGTAIGFGFLSGFSSAAEDRESTLNGSVPVPSLKNQVLGGLSAASFSVAENLLKDIRDHSVEHVVLPAGEDIYVVFEQKLVVDSEKGLQ